MKKRNVSAILQFIGGAILSSLLIGCTAQSPVIVAPPATEITAAQQTATVTPMPTATAIAEASANIPSPFQCYLDGVEAQDLEATTACFTEEALVVDVGREIAGRDAINRWLDNEVMGLIYEVDSSTLTQDGASVIVNIRFGSGSGGFRARYDVVIEDGLIQEMILRYA
ncbi:MAG: nuclear transport factor 2 family protein [Chloroflexota bacterium]